MNILLASSEILPFAKTGGLADVCGTLPVELAKLGHSVVTVMPAYGQVLRVGPELQPTGIPLRVPMGSKMVVGQLLRGTLPDSDVPVYFVRQDEYFQRPELYTEAGKDYKDNCERFVFFCRAVIQSLPQLPLPIDLVHCNDWQTGLIPAYLRIEGIAEGASPPASVMTIHNIAYQGSFWHWDMLLTGLDWKYFNWRQMEFHGQLNLLKTGLVFADAINTVSPTYAREIQSHPNGCGLESVLRHRSDVVGGILNGVDYGVWNPATDAHLEARYTPSQVQPGKAACKAALQAEVGLPQRPHTPLLGLIGRLADQKGWDLILEVIRSWTTSVDAQWVILGTGQPNYQDMIERLAEEFPQKVAARLTFSDPLAHRIEAGSDLFVMPSRFEPCGLNQLYSLKYGTVPVVRATGGLADTITNATVETLAAGSANGFSFRRYDPLSLDRTLRRACRVFRDEPDQWQALIRCGMSQDWSWTRSAERYIELYHQTRARRAVADQPG